MPSESVEARLETFADQDEAFGEAVFEYYRDDCATLPPHHLLVTLRRVDGVALYFESGNREWLLIAQEHADDARYRYFDQVALTGGSLGTGEPMRAIDIEDLLQQELPEIVDVQETPLADADQEVVEA